MVSPTDGREFEQALGVGDGQGSLVCCSPWGCKELDMTEQLNWTELNWCPPYPYKARILPFSHPGRRLEFTLWRSCFKLWTQDNRHRRGCDLNKGNSVLVYTPGITLLSRPLLLSVLQNNGDQEYALVVGRIMVPQRCPHSNPWTCEYGMLHDKGKLKLLIYLYYLSQNWIIILGIEKEDIGVQRWKDPKG